MKMLFSKLPFQEQSFLKTVGDFVSPANVHNLIPVAWKNEASELVVIDDFGVNDNNAYLKSLWMNSNLNLYKLGVEIVVETFFGALVVYDDRYFYRRFPGGYSNFEDQTNPRITLEREIFLEELYVVAKDKTVRLIPNNLSITGLSPSVDFMKINISDFETFGDIKYLGYSINLARKELSHVYSWDISNFKKEIMVFHSEDFADGSLTGFTLNCVNSDKEIVCDTSGQHGLVPRHTPTAGENFHQTVINYFDNKILPGFDVDINI